VEQEERYEPPIFAALACGSQEAVTTMLETQPKIHQDLHTLQVKWAPTGKNGIFSRNFFFSRKQGILGHLIRSGDVGLLRVAIAMKTYDPILKDSDGQTPFSRIVEYGGRSRAEAASSYGPDRHRCKGRSRADTT